VFVSPVVEDPRAVAEIVAHELIHVALPGHGHDKAFQRAAAALGYIKPFTQSHPTAEFWSWIEPLLAKLPAYPHAQLAAIRPEGAKKKQTARHDQVRVRHLRLCRAHGAEVDRAGRRAALPGSRRDAG